jgi:DNA invertase Pin-like site-specific DNA recombinase
MTNHVAFYARSSNDAHDVSCDSQLREFERLASEAGEIEVARRVDSAVSHFEAKGLLELLQLAKSISPPPFSKVYVWDTARISRVLYRQAKMMFEFESAGVELHICKQIGRASCRERV